MLDLTSSRRKIQRAKMHLNQAGWLARESLSRDDLQLLVQRREDRAEQGWVLAVVEPPPEEIAEICADAVNNLRSALNYVTWQAWVAGGGDRQSKDHRSVQYPIVSEEKRWAGVVDRYLPGVRTDLVELIRCAQPFTSPGEPHWLNDMASLSNSDKHKDLLVTALASREATWVYPALPEGLEGAMVVHDVPPVLERGVAYPIVSWLIVRVGEMEHGILDPVPWPPNVQFDLPPPPTVQLGLVGHGIAVPLVRIEALIGHVSRFLDQVDALPS